MPIESPKHMSHGKRNPLLLSPRLNYALFGTFFAGQVAVLLALITATGKYKDILASIARSAEAAELSAREKPAPPSVEKPAAPVAEGPHQPDSLRVSLPEGWQWRGCLAQSSSVEILLSPSAEPEDRTVTPAH